MPPFRIILASNSPRRKELLQNAGIDFVSDPADVDESRLPGELPAEYAVRLALDKALCTASRHADGIVVGADTVVVAQGEVLGKPSSTEDAARMLGMLSGRTHEVVTGIALVNAATGAKITASETTRVRMRALTRAQVEAYVATGEPMDKAGGYGIQGRASLFVESVEGCYFNVVGLPMARLAVMLGEMGAHVPAG
jgi:nucleoside triphosphate pyrophosphatase